MHPQKRSHTVLLAILIFNCLSTWLHYTDNALFLTQYPGPEWFTPLGIFLTVVIMTPVGWMGYWLYTQGKILLAYLLLGLYSITSISSPGHYLYPMAMEMSPKMHSLIWLDAIAGLLLIGFILDSALFRQEWLQK
jgi:hypothetical protein